MDLLETVEEKVCIPYVDSTEQDREEKRVVKRTQVFRKQIDQGVEDMQVRSYRAHSLFPLALLFQDMLSYRKGRKYSKFRVPKGKAKTLIPYKRETRDKFSDPLVKKEIDKFVLKQNKKMSWYISETEEQPDTVGEAVIEEVEEEEEVFQESVQIEERDYDSDEWSVESTYSDLEEGVGDEDTEDGGDIDSDSSDDE